MSRAATSSWTLRLLVAAVALAVCAPAAQVRAAAPTVQPPVIQAPPLNAKVGMVTIPVKINWPAAKPKGAKVARYTLQHSSDAVTWADVKLGRALARSVVVRLEPWNTHQFRLRATDRAGDVSSWAVSDALWLAYAHEDDLAASYSTGWSFVADARAHGGSRASSTTAGESILFDFSATRLAWVSRLGPNRGRASVYIDDVLIGVIDLRRSKALHRRVVFRASWQSAIPRTLRIQVEGTVGRPRIDVDAFVTLAPPTSATLVGAGDIGSCASGGDELTATVVESIDGIVFTTGDNAYPYGSASDLLSCYEPNWGSFKNRTRPSPGNHDYITESGAPYYDYFGARAGPAGRGWYSFQAGTWRVYSLNSEACRAANSWCAPGTPQFDWLAADLDASPHVCVLAYWHRPLFSSGIHGGSSRMAAINGLLYDHGAEVVLEGHDHNYERFLPADPDGLHDPTNGIAHFVVGTGGASLRPFDDEPLPITAVRQADAHGVLRLDLQPSSYEWEFVPVAGRAFSDTGSGECH